VTLLTPAELEAALRDIGARRYHQLHPFHKLLHGGKCSKGQVQAWALNRYYYQAMIPIKDASLIARCDDLAIRRQWRSRLVDHDGERDGEGGIARWLKLTDGLGLDRDYVVSLRGLLPGTRFAVEAYVRFVREKTLLEAIASSLTELFSPQIIGERMEGMLAGYPFVTRQTLAYFEQRPPQAARDADFALNYCKSNACTAETAAGGAGSARIQVRRTVGDVRCALSCLCGAQAHSAWRLRAGCVSRCHDRTDRPRHQAAPAARGPPDAQRGAGRLGAARAGAHLQGGCGRGRDSQALHRRGDAHRHRR
jgi:coenzyme PQQ biosynthesis protein C